MTPAQSSTIQNAQPDGPAAVLQGGAPQGDDRQSHSPISPDQAANVHPVLHEAPVVHEATLNRVEHPPGPGGPPLPVGSPVPEPRTLLLVGTGLLGLGVLTQASRRRRHPAASRGAN
jgi:hypothetical protein